MEHKTDKELAVELTIACINSRQRTVNVVPETGNFIETKALSGEEVLNFLKSAYSLIKEL